jgi:hypothetical protein
LDVFQHTRLTFEDSLAEEIWTLGLNLISYLPPHEYVLILKVSPMAVSSPFTSTSPCTLTNVSNCHTSPEARSSTQELGIPSSETQKHPSSRWPEYNFPHMTRPTRSRKKETVRQAFQTCEAHRVLGNKPKGLGMHTVGEEKQSQGYDLVCPPY